MRWLLTLTLLAEATAAFPQGPPPPDMKPSRPAYLDPIRERRVRIEETAARFGPAVRSLLEEYRDDAVGALKHLSLEGGRALGGLHGEGKFAKFAYPRPLLKALAAYHIDDADYDAVAAFVTSHADELADPAKLKAFLTGKPLEYAMALKTLDEGVAEMTGGQAGEARAAAKGILPAAPALPKDWANYALGGAGAAAALGFFGWRRWRRGP